MLQKLITVLVGYVLLIYVCLVRLPFERKKSVFCFAFRILFVILRTTN